MAALSSIKFLIPLSALFASSLSKHRLDKCKEMIGRGTNSCVLFRNCGVGTEFSFLVGGQFQLEVAP